MARLREYQIKTNKLFQAKKIGVSIGAKKILENITFKVFEGEILSILGESGSGKTTLLRALSQLIPISGELDLSNCKADDFGFIFQRLFIFPWLTIKENVEFGLKEKKNEEVESLLKKIGLWQFKDYFPKDISGGMAQRLAIARATILKPKVLLMDEPFSDLDVSNKSKLYNLILNLNKLEGITFIIVTHDIEEAIKISDRIIVLSNQKPATVKKVYKLSNYEEDLPLINSIINELNF